MADLRAKSEKELYDMARELKEKERDLRFLLRVGKAKNVREIRMTRKKIAQALSVIKEKQVS